MCLLGDCKGSQVDNEDELLCVESHDHEHELKTVIHFFPTGLRCCAFSLPSLTLRRDTTADGGKSNAGVWLEYKLSPQVPVLSAWTPAGGIILSFVPLLVSFSASCQPLPREAHPLLHNPTTMALCPAIIYWTLCNCELKQILPCLSCLQQVTRTPKYSRQGDLNSLRAVQNETQNRDFCPHYPLLGTSPSRCLGTSVVRF